MRQVLYVTIFVLSMTTEWVMASTATDTGTGEVPPRKETRISLEVQVTGGETQTPIEGAEVSVYASDWIESELLERKKSGKNGKVRFLDLPEGEIRIRVLAKGWETHKDKYLLQKEKMEIPVNLKRLDP